MRLMLSYGAQGNDCEHTWHATVAWTRNTNMHEHEQTCNAMSLWLIQSLKGHCAAHAVLWAQGNCPTTHLPHPTLRATWGQDRCPSCCPHNFKLPSYMRRSLMSRIASCVPSGSPSISLGLKNYSTICQISMERPVGLFVAQDNLRQPLCFQTSNWRSKLWPRLFKTLQSTSRSWSSMLRIHCARYPGNWFLGATYCTGCRNVCLSLNMHVQLETRNKNVGETCENTVCFY